MRNAVFALTPFYWPEMPHPTLTGRLAIANDTLWVEYDLSGLNQPADLPTPSPNPARRLQLWQHTCFELLWGPLHHPTYWELNASPSGDWNLFAFDDYRDGMIEEPPGPYRFAPAVIILLDDGQRTFWATRHPGDAPDFHHPLSFTLTA